MIDSSLKLQKKKPHHTKHNPTGISCCFSKWLLFAPSAKRQLGRFEEYLTEGSALLTPFVLKPGLSVARRHPTIRFLGKHPLARSESKSSVKMRMNISSFQAVCLESGWTGDISSLLGCQKKRMLFLALFNRKMLKEFGPRSNSFFPLFFSPPPPSAYEGEHRHPEGGE